MMTLQQAFDKAILNPENRYEVVDGFHEKSDEQTHNINWNCVDADCAMDTLEMSSYHSIEGKFEGEFSMNACAAYYDKFDAMCDEYEKNLPLWHE
jgi:hypothetical protein